METMAFHGIHPGTILAEELQVRGLSAAAFARQIRVPAQRIQEIVAGTRAITPETALRIGAGLSTGGRLWATMQAAYDLHRAELQHSAQIQREVMVG